MSLPNDTHTSRKTRNVVLATFSDDDAIKTAIATSTSVQTYSGGALNGAVGVTAMDPPRTVSITRSSSVGSYSLSPIVATGTDGNDQVITESLTPANADGNDVLVGTKGFKTVTSVAFPAQVNTSGQFKIGTRDLVLGTPCRQIRANAAGTIKGKEEDGNTQTSPSLSAGEVVVWGPNVIYGDSGTTVTSMWLMF